MAQSARWEVVNNDGDRYHEEGAKRYNSAQNLRWIADLLDSRFRVLGVPLGWDAILGLIPGLGDLTTNLASFYIMVQASNLGAPPSVILRMGLNLLIDNLLDSIPVLGNLADIFWRANTRNVALLDRYMRNPRRTSVRSGWVVALTIGVVMVSALACAALALYFGWAVLRWAAAGMAGW
jgi:hypothetical protein